jgi:hypothetical protein
VPLLLPPLLPPLLLPLLLPPLLLPPPGPASAVDELLPRHAGKKKAGSEARPTAALEIPKRTII